MEEPYCRVKMLGLEIQDGGVPLDPLLTTKCEVKQVPEPFASQFLYMQNGNEHTFPH